MDKNNFDRVILHCDLNSFFASVECLDLPHLKNVPMAVAGNTEDRHGIILAKNEAAKKFNVKTAETIWQAKLKCPNLVTVPPHFEKYKYYSDKINEIYYEYTDMGEPFSIDESWLDVTGSQNLFGTGYEIAQKISNEIKEKTHLTVSIGVSFNKIFAKLGSDYKKPDAITVISKENYKDVVFPLPASDMLFVGRATLSQLEKVGIRTIGDIANSQKSTLVKLLGKMGETLYICANGLDTSPVVTEREKEKSIGNGHTFKRNLIGEEDVKKALTFICDTVSTRLRKKGYKCKNVCVTIKDTDLKSISRRKKIDFYTNTERDLFETAFKIISENWNFENPIRMLTVTAADFEDEKNCEQMSFFDTGKTQDKKLESFDSSIDEIRRRFGNNAVSFASQLENDILSK
ncbi:MAG: DNA polymerase IV [Oscillospiraceae bacterium]|nr:DNA polymerase IV [Oscillospiraceae bacterium]